MEKVGAKILLVGIDLGDLNQIRTTLSGGENYKFFEAYNLKDSFTLIKENKIDLIIFDFDDLTSEKINSILTLRSAEEKSPMVLLSNTVNSFALEIIRVFPNILVLEKPRAIKELPHVTTKFLRGETLLQRKYKRFDTHQEGLITLMSNGRDYKCTILNLSQGGAFLKIKGITDKMDGLVKIKLSLDQLQKDHHLSAKVIWASVKNDEGYFGIQFIKNNEIYSQFLKNF